MNEGFFGKNGTLQGLMDFANNYQGAKSDSGTQRLGALGRIVSMIMSLLA